MLEPAFLLVTGVSGAGKTTIGERLAAGLGWRFIDADDFHSAGNLAKMKAGLPLEDADRAAWLDDVAAAMDACRRRGEKAIVACSALRRAYRDRLIHGASDVQLVYLRSAPALAESRVRHRGHHFMPASLVPSQFETLEEPGPDERAIVVDAALDPGLICTQICEALSERESDGRRE